MSDHTQIKGISLDAAGTLIEVAEPVAEVYGRLAVAHGAELNLEALAEGFRTHFPGMTPMAFGQVDADALARLERGWWRTLVRRVVSGAGHIDTFDAFFDDLFDHYGEPAAWRLFDEVPAVLGTLRELGLGLVVLSNFDSRLERVAAGLGLSDQVDEVLYSTRIGAAKPDSAAFAAASTALGQPPENCLHVGDDRRADLEGAQAAGFEARLLDRRPRSRHNPKLPTVQALSELIDNFK